MKIVKGNHNEWCTFSGTVTESIKRITQSAYEEVLQLHLNNEQPQNEGLLCSNKQPTQNYINKQKELKLDKVI